MRRLPREKKHNLLTISTTTITTCLLPSQVDILKEETQEIKPRVRPADWLRAADQVTSARLAYNSSRNSEGRDVLGAEIRGAEQKYNNIKKTKINKKEKGNREKKRILTYLHTLKKGPADSPPSPTNDTNAYIRIFQQVYNSSTYNPPGIFHHCLRRELVIGLYCLCLCLDAE